MICYYRGEVVMRNDLEIFCRECVKRENELALNKSFDNLESGGKEYSYNSIFFCLIDAVFSIGVKYKSVENTVARYANYYNLDLYNDNFFDQHKLEDFINNYKSFYNNSPAQDSSFAESVLKNRQRTSPKNGILKSEACYEIALKLYGFGINSLSDFRNLNINQICELEKIVNTVKGQRSGIMFSYFCMLCGDENSCKPDRWIKRFLEEIGLEKIAKDNEKIQSLFQNASKKLKVYYPNISTRYLDYQIWAYQKGKDNS